ncbi:PGF-pre-PGF domain-containing protein [Candidatus Woesearchaeota archaeon]|nr:PGF-pre-PGF domain-containing protein [Candidatus Woesearchaeota archaeon]
MKLTTLLLITVLLFPTVMALSEDFQASGPDVIPVYSCSPAESVLYVSNTGAVTSVYSVFQDGPASSFATLDYPTFTLLPGQTAALKNSFATPCTGEETFSLVTTIRTSFGLQKTLEQTVSALIPDNVDSSLLPEKSEVRPCHTGTFTLSVHNPINFNETYLISASSSLEVQLSNEQVTVAPGQTKNVTVTMQPEQCTFYGDVPLEVTVMGQNSGVVKKHEALLTVLKSYIPEIVVSRTSYTNYYEEQWIPVEITNIGDEDAGYEIMVQGADFVTAQPATLSVAGGQTESVVLYADPSNETAAGEYDITVTLKVLETGTQYTAAPISLTLKQHNMITRFYAAHPVYSWLIVLGALVIIVLIVLIVIKVTSKEYKEKRKEHKKKKEQQRKEKEKFKRAKKAEKKRDKREALSLVKEDYFVIKKQRERQDSLAKKLVLAAILVLILAAIGVVAYMFRSVLFAQIVYVLAALLLVAVVVFTLLSFRLRSISYFTKRDEKLRKKQEKIEKREARLAQKYAKREKELQERLQKQQEEWEQKRRREKKEQKTSNPLPKAVFAVILAVLVIGLVLIGAFFFEQLLAFWPYVVTGAALLFVIILVFLMLRKFSISRNWSSASGHVVVPTKWRYGLGDVRLHLSKTVEHLVMRITRGRPKEAFVVPDADVYQYFSIFSSVKEKCSLSLRVKKAWADKHEDLTVLHFVRGSWKPLQTKKMSEKGRWTYFTAESDKGGHFAIAAKRKSSPPRIGVYLATAVLALALLGLFIFFPSIEPEFNGIPRQTWSQDTVHTLDLTQFFQDPDSDELLFSTTPTNNIDVFIDRDGVAVFTPAAGWTGEETIVFTARDNEGEAVSSNTVVLRVTPGLIPAKIWPWVKYGIIGLLLIVLIISVVQFRRQLSKYLEE